MKLLEFISLVIIFIAMICIYSMIYFMFGKYALFGFLAFTVALIFYFKNDNYDNI